jgi:competence protein ComEC
MDPGRPPQGPAAWFVRRAGLARFATIAFAGGLALAGLIGGRPLAAALGMGVSLAVVLAGVAQGRRRPGSSGALSLVCCGVIASALLSGLFLGGFRVAAVLEGGYEGQVGSVVEAELVMTGAVRAAAGWLSGPAEFLDTGKKVLLEVSPSGEGRTPVGLSQGAIIQVKGRLLQPKGPTASGFDQAKQLLHQGIVMVLRVDDGAGITVLGRRGGPAGWFDRLRAAAKEHLSLGPSASIGEVLEGVVMGDTAGIDPDWAEAFRRSGTAHMLSVSGLHVGSLAAIMIGLAALARLSRRAGFLLAAASALLMIPFVGGSPPIVRAAAMIVVVLAGRWVGRRRDSWQGLAVAAAVVLAINPFAVFDVGFQLSFSALAGLLLFTGPIQRRLVRLPPAIAANLAVSLAATLGTAPVSLAAFGRTSLVAPLANLLVVPTLPAVTGLGLASVFLGFVWSGLSVALDTLASLPMSWTILVARVGAMAPVLETRDAGRLLAAVGAGFLVLPVALALRGRNPSLPVRLRLPFFRRTVAWVSRHRPQGRRRGAVAAVALVLCAALLGGIAYPAAGRGFRSAEALIGREAWPDGVEVRMLDVGQGTAVLVRTPAHQAMLFDAGPVGCDLAGQLRGLGVRRLELAVVSHPHLDHFGGLLEAAGEVGVELFVDRVQVEAGAAAGGSEASSPATSGSREAAQYLDLRRALEAAGSRCLTAGMGWTLRLDGVVVRLYAPAQPLPLMEGGDPWAKAGGPPSGDELNGGSLVALVSVGETDFLLPGDAEAAVLARYGLPSAEVLVVPHHGSRGAVSADLLEGLESLAALISVGERNSFGHPDPSTLALLQDSVPLVLRSDRCGWVSCRVKDGVINICGERTVSP